MPPTSSRPAEIEALMRAVSSESYDLDGHSPREAPRSASAIESTVGDLQRQVSAVVADLARTRDALAVSLRDAEAQLARLHEENAALKSEREHLNRLKGLYERKFASIRDLAKSDQDNASR